MLYADQDLHAVHNASHADAAINPQTTHQPDA
jgi:hypothetical protein